MIVHSNIYKYIICIKYIIDESSLFSIICNKTKSSLISHFVWILTSTVKNQYRWFDVNKHYEITIDDVLYTLLDKTLSTSSACRMEYGSMTAVIDFRKVAFFLLIGSERHITRKRIEN